MKIEMGFIFERWVYFTNNVLQHVLRYYNETFVHYKPPNFSSIKVIKTVFKKKHIFWILILMILIWSSKFYSQNALIHGQQLIVFVWRKIFQVLLFSAMYVWTEENIRESETDENLACVVRTKAFYKRNCALETNEPFR